MRFIVPLLALTLFIPMGCGGESPRFSSENVDSLERGVSASATTIMAESNSVNSDDLALFAAKQGLPQPEALSVVGTPVTTCKLTSLEEDGTTQCVAPVTVTGGLESGEANKWTMMFDVAFDSADECWTGELTNINLELESGEDQPIFFEGEDRKEISGCLDS